jgi:hypothetical protein
MATYRKVTVYFWPQSAQNPAQLRHAPCCDPARQRAGSVRNSLNSIGICHPAANGVAAFARARRSRIVSSTYEQNFRRNIVLADDRAECRLGYRDHPVIMQHVLGDSA